MIFSMKRGPDYAIGHSAKWVLVQYYISIAFVQINAIFVSFFAILTVVHEWLSSKQGTVHPHITLFPTME